MAAERLTYDHEPIAKSPKRVAPLYEQSKNELAGLPEATLAREKDDEITPNIYNIKSEGVPGIWAPLDVYTPGKAIPPRFIFIEKADIGGVGGHTKASTKVKEKVLDHVLRYNRWGKDGKPIFTSLFASHTGDDVAITGIFDEKVAEHKEIFAELLWDAFQKGTGVAIEHGDYGPGQDLKADAFTGNTHGLGPALVVLPLPMRKDNPSQVVVAMYADKTEPGVYNYITTRSYLNPEYNTGLLIADSKMNRGYVFEITDLNTKAQAIEGGAHPLDKKAIDEAMERFGKTERVIQVSAPEGYYDICRLTMDPSRFVVSKIYAKNDEGKPDQLGAVVSAERLHNIKTAKGFTYGGKDDPVMLSLAQGDWPAPGEITSPMALTPLVAGDCRGSHYLNISPMPINSTTSYFSGPILSVLSLSVNIHTGRIGAISDQFALGTPWDKFRDQAAEQAQYHRNSQGFRTPGTLPVSEMEYQNGYVRNMDRLSKEFKRQEI